MKRRLRIGIATSGRFHVLDLARELHRLGHDVSFYSYIPRARALGFGLPAECHIDLFPFLAPLALLQMRAGKVAPRLVERATWMALDYAVSIALRPCDIFMFMSGIYLSAPRRARERYGAKLVLIRGSKHILAQDEILAALPGAERPTKLSVRRELEGYALADQIASPSTHAKASFAAHGVDPARIHLNPYGVDLESFPLVRRAPPSGPIRFVYAGMWSLRKGCDLLVEAVRANPGVRLQHVGDITDHPFPHGDPQFQHTPKVDQRRLSAIYAAADAFVLASREDGFGVVLGQALASGLPVVCTRATGGPDLRHTPALRDRICLVPPGDAEALAEALAQVKARLTSGPEFMPMTEADRQTLTWEAFARRHERTLLKLVRDEAV